MIDPMRSSVKACPCCALKIECQPSMTGGNHYLVKHMSELCNQTIFYYSISLVRLGNKSHDIRISYG